MKLQLSRSFVTVILFLACVALVLLAQGGPVQACQDGIGGGQEIQVVVGPLLIRSSPAGDIIGTLAVGKTFVITEQIEANGYLWAGHAHGWSALHALDCSDVFTQSTGAVSASSAPAAEDAPAPPPPPAGDDNKCYTDWDFCNTGTPDEIAYKWRLGYWTAAQESGMVPEHAEPKDLAEGKMDSITVRMVMPTKAPESSGPKPERTPGPEMTPEMTQEGN